MLQTFLRSTRLRRSLTAAALVAAACTVVAPAAEAHFVLKTPASWMSQDVLGNPQKLGPCGDDAGGTVTGEVTSFAAGETITITIDETIFHPGHYRIALALNDRSELPPEPVVTPGSTDCGSVEIMDPPVFPVLADGVFLHTASFGEPQTIQVTLPADVSCDHCTLQIIEFMSNHGLNNPGGCFYHHCADIAIGGGSSTGGAGGSTASTGGAGGSTASTNPTTTGGSGGASMGGTGGAGGDGETDSSSGCGCSIPGGESPSFAAIAGLLGLALLRRKRR